MSGRSPDQSRSDSGVYTNLLYASLASRDFCQISWFHVQQLHRVFAVRSPLKRLRNRDRMCNRITAHARRYDYHLVRASPRHPASVRKCSMWLPVLFRFLVDSLATLGHRLAASRITSHVVGDPGVVLLGMSRQMPLKRAQKALQTHETGFRCPPGHGKPRKTLTEALRRSSAPIPLTRAFRSPGNRASPCKAHCPEQAAMRLVGGRRPSVLQRWGLGFSPDGFR